MCVIDLTNIELIFAYFIWDLFRFFLKLSPLMENYLAEEETFFDGKLSCKAREV
jgi:hypothetical protein